MNGTTRPQRRAQRAWRRLRLGETLRDGDQWWDGKRREWRDLWQWPGKLGYQAWRRLE